MTSDPRTKYKLPKRLIESPARRADRVAESPQPSSRCRTRSGYNTCGSIGPRPATLATTSSLVLARAVDLRGDCDVALRVVLRVDWRLDWRAELGPERFLAMTTEIPLAGRYKIRLPLPGGCQ